MERLIFLTLSLTTGGAERVICNLCNGHFVRHYRVTVISLMAAKPEYALDSAVEVLYVDRSREQYTQNMALRFARRRKRLSSLLRRVEKRKEKTGVLISFLPEPNFLITSLPKREYPVIISVRNDPAKEYASRIRRMLMKKLYPRADGYVFQTGQAREYFSFSRKITEDSVVIPNPLAEEFLDVPSSALSRKEIVAVGRLEAQKAPLLLIRAFARIHKSYPEYRLLFYGEGSMREEMEALIGKEGLEQNVEIKGNTDDIFDAVGKASLFVLPSVYEGMPNALLEAMALGVPCIATDCPCGAPRELIRSGENGVLVPVGEEGKLTEAMAFLLKDPERAACMGRSAQEITKRLAPERIYQEWDRLIEARRSSRGKREQKNSGRK